MAARPGVARLDQQKKVGPPHALRGARPLPSIIDAIRKSRTTLVEKRARYGRFTVAHGLLVRAVVIERQIPCMSARRIAIVENIQP
jgi:hypothetical protein